MMRADGSTTAPARLGLGLALVLALLLAGCSISNIAPAPATPRIFDLSAAAAEGKARGTADWQLAIIEPIAVRALEGDRIAVRTSATEISYFADAVWADRLPRLLQARLIETLAASRRFRAVGNGRDRLEADLTLLLEIEAFEVEVGKGGARARVALSAKLIDERRGAAVLVRHFSAEQTVARDDAAAGAAALSAALAELAPRLLAWAAVAPPPQRPRETASLQPPSSADPRPASATP